MKKPGYWITLLLACAIPSCAPAPERPLPTRSLTTFLADADTAGFARAVTPRTFRFPVDHGPHPAFRNEWWYITGNLTTTQNRRFGYQLTFFRIALAPKADSSISAWRTNQIYMAHFSVTDVENRRYHHSERFSRAALDLAGATTSPTLHVWLEDWEITGAPNATFPLRLRARDDAMAIDLELGPGKPIVLQGDRGLSRKGEKPGNASYYYSLPRLPTTGTLTVTGEHYRVTGESWMDREWSTSALEPGQIGWDWFALQFDDNRELMFYRLRRDDRSVDPHSSGVFIAPDGSTRLLTANDVNIRVEDHWDSSDGLVRYPARWRITIAGMQMSLEVRPVLAAQEFTGVLRYWEGAVDVTGTGPDGPITGHGYVELTGYDTRNGQRPLVR